MATWPIVSIKVADPKLGPCAELAARALLRKLRQIQGDAGPDGVIVILTKNISATEGRTGVGTAAVFEMSEAMATRILGHALEALKP